MASPITVIKSHGIDTTGDYVVNSISSTGNVSAGNIKTDHLLYANGTPYVFTTNAAGTNTQIQFNDGNSFAGSANLTFNKTTGTLTTNFFVGNGSQLTGLPASYTDTNANSAIDARVTKYFIDNLGINANTLNGHSDTYFATSTQGNLADSAVQPGDLSTVATSGSYTDLTNKPTLFDGEYASLANKPSLFDGTYANLTGKPSLFDGEYASLANKPTLFSGSYVDLTNKPTLGTAAATDANAYATAAQGTKADTALQAANLVGYATESYVGNSIANLVASAPAALDTLNELANALGNDASYSTTITNALANKLSTSNFASTANTWISTQTTSNLSEGSNLYYTVERANTAIDNRVTKTFVDNLAVVANIANVAYSVSGSNVSGPVQYAAIANSVSSANVVGDVAGANHANIADVANSVAGSNVTGQVANALVAGTVYTNAQPNITSVGTLSSLTVSGITDLGSISNVIITGGSSGQFLRTDGTGNLTWANSSGGTTISTSIGVSTFIGDGTTDTFTLSTAPANVNNIIVNYGGMILSKSSYTLSGSNITFTSAPFDGADIEVSIIESVGYSSSLAFGWSVVSANTTVMINKGYFVDTTSQVVELTLPANPSLGDMIRINDLAGNFGTNYCRVKGNGNKIQGALSDLLLDYAQAGVGLAYSTATYGWKIMEL